MTRLTLSLFVLTAALTGCGGAYYEEGGGPATPQVEYANVQAQANVETATNQDVYIGDGTGEVYEDTDPTAVTEFRSTLDPYGTWVEDEQYGTVWVPSSTVVGADFAPYVSAGHWSYGSEYVWVSDYDWGWAPFHYGRWTYINARGWSWIPGRRYSGAWVTWRTGYDGWGYVGWAPLPPTWYWRGGYAYGIGWGISAPYVFCAHEHLFNPGVHAHIVGGAQVGAIGQHTRPYTPANPNVGVGGRNPANPSVNGYSTGGPPPGQLGINSAPVPPQGHPGLLKAQQYATPSSAVAVGARPPQIGSGAAHVGSQSTAANAMPNRSPNYGANYGSRSMGSSFTPSPRPYNPSQGTAQQQPTYRNPQNMPQQLPRPTQSYSQPTQSFQSQPHYQQSQPSFQSQPHYQSQPTQSFQSQPHFSPSPSPAPQQHSFGGGSVGGSTGGSFGASRASPSIGGGGGGSFGGGGGHVGGSTGGGRVGGGGGMRGGRR